MSEHSGNGEHSDNGEHSGNGEHSDNNDGNGIFGYDYGSPGNHKLAQVATVVMIATAAIGLIFFTVQMTNQKPEQPAPNQTVNALAINSSLTTGKN